MASHTRAWTYTGGYPDTLKLTNITPPTASEFKDDESDPHVLVKIHACALNPVDIQIMNIPSWKYPWNALYGKEKGTGDDFSGTVIAGGHSGFKEGDEVMGLTLAPMKPNGGALGEIADLSLANSLLVKKPSNWSFEKASAINLVWLTAKACIDEVAKHVDESSNKRVAVLGGSSSTGIYTIMLAKRRGWHVATTSSAKNKEFVTSTLKADEHIDYTARDVRDAMLEFGPDAVIDCVGGTECIGLPSSKRYITIVGDKTGRSTMGGPYTWYDYFAPQRAASQWLRWTKGYLGVGEKYDVVMLGMKKEWLEDATLSLSEDDIYIDSTFAFEDAKKAFEKLNTGRARGKVVVKVAK